jgi:NAD+ synthetase
MEELMRQQPAVHINLSSSPFWHGKRALRQQMLAAIARRDGVPVLMCNQVGGNDSLIFDGSSMALNARGELIAQAASFEEDVVVVDLNNRLDSPAAPAPEEDDTAAAYDALVLGTRDYVRKCGFRKVLIGLSGGIDSALVAAIAKEALGAENVMGIGMPSPYSSSGSIDDSRQLAANLGIRFEVIGINGLFQEYTQALEPLFAGLKADTTEENIQSRIRGGLLMALSNKFSALVLTTGNKSEMAVGYCTLYGDMVGALAVIGDLVKTRVYAVCNWLNRDGEVIPRAILEKPPSAELRPDQKDTDSLPPYEVLDPILEAYVERYETPEKIAQAYGFPLQLVQDVVRLVERSEYKRQQAAPVLKVTSKSFGMGRRFPTAVKVQV